MEGLGTQEPLAAGFPRKLVAGLGPGVSGLIRFDPGSVGTLVLKKEYRVFVKNTFSAVHMCSSTA